MKKAILSITAAILPLTAAAQDITGILQSIERNNKELQAAKKSGEAQMLELKEQNTLDDTSIEYSPFFKSGASGVASSELVVKQGFDFPTLYASRSKAEKRQQAVTDLKWFTVRRDVLATAKALCLDLILINQERALLDKRRDNAARLLSMAEKRLSHGDGTILDVNKVKMERMNIETEVLANTAARNTALEALRAINGNIPLAVDMTEYPSTAASQPSSAASHPSSVIDYQTLLNNAIAAELTLRTADAEVAASQQDVKVNRMGLLPKLEIGYRRNTDGSEASNGFMVGASLPLFSGKSKIKTAKARLEETTLNLDNTRIQTESRIRSLISELQQTRTAADVYDTALLHTTLDLLYKAVEGGEITIMEYYVEADAIYKNLQAHLQLENQCQKILAEITKNEL
ncbi:MAG: TolC family protein [Prevotella sp.]|nr:TolC family protein [Prevotella sp.]